MSNFSFTKYTESLFLYALSYFLTRNFSCSINERLCQTETHLDIFHYAPNINIGVYLVPC